MAKKTTRPKTGSDSPGKRDATDDTPGVEALIAQMSHPLLDLLQEVRQTILRADKRITEGVKWNSPSFYCEGWFATLGTRKRQELEIVLHHGAKIRQDASLQQTLDDPGNLLHWKSADRAIITLAEGTNFKTIRPQLAALVQQWAAYQRELASRTSSASNRS